MSTVLEGGRDCGALSYTLAPIGQRGKRPCAFGLHLTSTTSMRPSPSTARRLAWTCTSDARLRQFRSRVAAAQACSVREPRCAAPQPPRRRGFDDASVTGAGERLGEAGLASVAEDREVCCFAERNKVFTHDPQGMRWGAGSGTGLPMTHRRQGADCEGAVRMRSMEGTAAPVTIRAPSLVARLGDVPWPVRRLAPCGKSVEGGPVDRDASPGAQSRKLRCLREGVTPAMRMKSLSW